MNKSQAESKKDPEQSERNNRRDYKLKKKQEKNWKKGNK